MWEGNGKWLRDAIFGLSTCDRDMRVDTVRVDMNEVTVKWNTIGIMWEAKGVYFHK